MSIASAGPVALVRSRLSSPSRRFLRGATFLVAWIVVALAAAWGRMELRVAYALLPPPSASFVLPSVETSRFMAARYHEAAADMIWTKLLIYYGEQTTWLREPAFMSAYVESIVSLDPMFRAPYAWAGYGIPLSTTGWMNPANIEAGIRFLRMGVARFPDDAELHGTLGYNLFYELPRWITDRDSILRAKVEGSEEIRKQVALGGGPEWLALAVTASFRDINLDDVAARNLEASAFATDDPQVRARILGRLATLRASTDVESIRNSIDALEDARRIRFPYAPMLFFVLVTPNEDLQRMSEGMPPEPLPEELL